MTSRERLLTAMTMGMPDRVPVAPFGLGLIPDDSPIAEELIEKTDIIIPVGAGGDPLLGKSEIKVETVGDTTISTIPTPKGDLVQKVRHTGWTHAIAEFYFKSEADAEKSLSLPYEPPHVDLTGYNRWCERLGDRGLAMVGVPDGICLPAACFSPEMFCLTWADSPDLMTELTLIAAKRINEFVERLCKAGVEAFRMIGGEYASVQLGPRAFNILCRDPDREMADIMRSHGAMSYYHNHGKVMPYLPDLAAIGIDALDPMEAPPWGDVDLAEARRILGDRVCMVGNLDDMEVVDKLDDATVCDIARERLAAAGKRGFVLGGTASGTYGERAAHNFIAMVRVAEEMA